MNATTNYQLSQWDASDRVLRTDFNADNAKIEAALTGLETRLALLERSGRNLGFYLGQVLVRHFRQDAHYPSQRCIGIETFEYLNRPVLTGGAVVENGILKLSGVGSTGTFTGLPGSISKTDWTQARLWLHTNGRGTVTPVLGGEAMTPVLSYYGRSAKGFDAYEHEYVLNGRTGTYEIVLNLDCGTSSSMEVYDYFVIFN